MCSQVRDNYYRSDATVPADNHAHSALPRQSVQPAITSHRPRTVAKTTTHAAAAAAAPVPSPARSELEVSRA